MKKHTCIICNRKFPEGQGIIIDYGGKKLEFHSSRCASKFLRILLERVPKDILKGYIDRIVDEVRERREIELKTRMKRI